MLGYFASPTLGHTAVVVQLGRVTSLLLPSSSYNILILHRADCIIVLSAYSNLWLTFVNEMAFHLIIDFKLKRFPFSWYQFIGFPGLWFSQIVTRMDGSSFGISGR